MSNQEENRGDRCMKCGGQVELRTYKHVEKIGELTVTDSTGRVPQCKDCGAPRLSLDDLHRYELRAVKTAMLEGRTDGAVMKYARKAMGFTQKELGAILGYRAEEVSRWENDAAVPQSVVQAMIGLLMRVEVGETPEEMQHDDGPARGADLEVRQRRAC